MIWKNRRVLVTGSAGVIGRKLVKRLISKEARVLSVDIAYDGEIDSSVNYIQADLSDKIPNECVVFKPEIVFHLAATFERTIEAPGYWKTSFDNNVLASHKLLEEMVSVQTLKLFVFASSYLIYEPKLYLNVSKVQSLKETSSIAPRNLVGLAKYFTERELDFIQQTDNCFRVASARIFRVYGCGSRDVISRWIRASLRGEQIEVWGKQNRFDYIWADDVAEGLIRIAESNNAKGVINLGSGIDRSIGEVVDILKKALDALQVKEISYDMPAEASRADMTLFKEIVGWMPKVSLEEGIRRIIEYERQRI